LCGSRFITAGDQRYDPIVINEIRSHDRAVLGLIAAMLRPTVTEESQQVTETSSSRCRFNSGGQTSPSCS